MPLPRLTFHRRFGRWKKIHLEEIREPTYSRWILPDIVHEAAIVDGLSMPTHGMSSTAPRQTKWDSGLLDFSSDEYFLLTKALLCGVHAFYCTTTVNLLPSDMMRVM